MQATEILMSSSNAADAMERAQALTKDIDQDWEHEATIYTFDDESVLVVSGPQVNAYPDREAADAALDPTVKVVPQGGTRFAAYQHGSHVGNFEFGTIDEDGQYVEDDDEIAEYCREYFGLAEDAPIVVG